MQNKRVKDGLKHKHKLMDWRYMKAIFNFEMDTKGSLCSGNKLINIAIFLRSYSYKTESMVSSKVCNYSINMVNNGQG